MSADTQLSLAWDSIRASATAALRAAGYRVVRGGGEHYRTIETLEFSIDPERKLIPRLDALRRKRNTGAYDDYGLVAQGEADLAGKLAAEVRKDVEDWIRKIHADCRRAPRRRDGISCSKAGSMRRYWQNKQRGFQAANVPRSVVVARNLA